MLRRALARGDAEGAQLALANERQDVGDVAEEDVETSRQQVGKDAGRAAVRHLLDA